MRKLTSPLLALLVALSGPATAAIPFRANLGHAISLPTGISVDKILGRLDRRPTRQEKLKSLADRTGIAICTLVAVGYGAAGWKGAAGGVVTALSLSTLVELFDALWNPGRVLARVQMSMSQDRNGPFELHQNPWSLVVEEATIDDSWRISRLRSWAGGERVRVAGTNREVASPIVEIEADAEVRPVTQTGIKLTGKVVEQHLYNVWVLKVGNLRVVDGQTNEVHPFSELE